MITKHYSWSLGSSSRSFAEEEATPNKSLDPFGASICSLSTSDLTGAGKSGLPFRQAFCTLTSALCIGQIHLWLHCVDSVHSVHLDSCAFVSIRGFTPSVTLDLTLFNAF